MPTKRRHKLREHNSERTREGIGMLVRGIDVFGDFTGAGDELGELWEVYGQEITERYVAIDGTTRPAGWWWFTAPQKIRIAWPGHPPLPTTQREILLEAKLLDAEAAKTAREKIAAAMAAEASGEPIACFDYKQRRPEILP